MTEKLKKAIANMAATVQEEQEDNTRIAHLSFTAQLTDNPDNPDNNTDVILFGKGTDLISVLVGVAQQDESFASLLKAATVELFVRAKDTLTNG